MSDYFDLGSYGRQVTGSARAQTLAQTAGLCGPNAFNHEEAAACFERAAGADPGCVIWRAGGWPTRWARTTTSRGRRFGPGEAPAGDLPGTGRAGAMPRARPGRRPRWSARCWQALAARYPAAAPASDGAWDPEDGASA